MVSAVRKGNPPTLSRGGNQQKEHPQSTEKPRNLKGFFAIDRQYSQMTGPNGCGFVFLRGER